MVPSVRAESTHLATEGQVCVGTDISCGHLETALVTRGVTLQCLQEFWLGRAQRPDGDCEGEKENYFQNASF